MNINSDLNNGVQFSSSTGSLPAPLVIGLKEDLPTSTHATNGRQHGATLHVTSSKEKMENPANSPFKDSMKASTVMMNYPHTMQHFDSRNFVQTAGISGGMINPVSPNTMVNAPTSSSSAFSLWNSGLDGFSIEKGTLEVVQIQRKACRFAPRLPLPTLSPKDAPILQEFHRPWRALRLKPSTSSSTTLSGSLLMNYEPRFTPGEATYPSLLQTPVLLEPRIAIEGAFTYLISAHLKLTLGTIEPLFCRLVIYDVSVGCRVTEEYGFLLDGPFHQQQQNPAQIQRALSHALFHTLPNHQLQHLCLVLKISKVLQGDGDSATAPYSHPEKLLTEVEQYKLTEKASDCIKRLGKYQQPLAWGAIALMEGNKRPMTLYRQRATMADEQRIICIQEAVRGTYKEKTVPGMCEFDIERFDDSRIMRGKFMQENNEYKKSDLTIVDPFSIVDKREEIQKPTWSREVQPFPLPSMTSMFGMTGSGPVAVSYVNTLYLYPNHVEKSQHRNLAVRVQLLEKETDFVGSVSGLQELAAATVGQPIPTVVLKAIYSNHGGDMSTYAFTQVNYHQKNPQFEDEIKICLPQHLTSAHHLLFSFYHVHCKKLQPNQPQQDLVGYAVMPVLDKQAVVLQDAIHAMNVIPVTVPSKPSPAGHVATLQPGYVSSARESTFDVSKMSFSCRSRLLSSVHTQDAALASFLRPVQSTQLAVAMPSDEEIVKKLLALKNANASEVRYFCLVVIKLVLGYLRFGSEMVRWAAFRALLYVLDKCNWNPHRSYKVQETNQILQAFVQLCFDENAIENPFGLGARPTAAVGNTTASSGPHTNTKGSTSSIGGTGIGIQQPQAVFQAVVMEWIRVLQDKNVSVEETLETKRLALGYSNVLLQLILKSMSMHLLNTANGTGSITPVSSPSSNSTSTLRFSAQLPSLPLALPLDDEKALEALMLDLIQAIRSSQNGLLLQKEVNKSLAFFCRSLFLIAKNKVSAQTIKVYLRFMSEKEEANTLIHMVFPFLRILIEFEFFPQVNTYSLQGLVPKFPGKAWLAKLVLEKLIGVVEGQKEEKLRSEALRILRRMFVTHVFNPRYQSEAHQQEIALMYFPFIHRILKFTEPNKLLSRTPPVGQAIISPGAFAVPGDAALRKVISGTPNVNPAASTTSGSFSNVPTAATDKAQEFRKELLICVAHLLSSVSDSYLKWFFKPAVVQTEVVHVNGSATTRSSLGERSYSTSSCSRTHGMNGGKATSPLGAASVSRRRSACDLEHIRKIMEDRKAMLRNSSNENIPWKSVIGPSCNQTEKEIASTDLRRRVQQEFENEDVEEVEEDEFESELLGSSENSFEYNESRTSACFIILQLLADTFLVDCGTSWQSILSPDLVVKDSNRLSLLDIELHMKNRQGQRLRGLGGNPGALSGAASGGNGVSPPIVASGPGHISGERNSIGIIGNGANSPMRQHGQSNVGSPLSTSVNGSTTSGTTFPSAVGNPSRTSAAGNGSHVGGGGSSAGVAAIGMEPQPTTRGNGNARSLPRNWGKTSSTGQRKPSTANGSTRDEVEEEEIEIEASATSPVASKLNSSIQQAASSVVSALTSTGVSRTEYDGNIRALHQIVAHTILRALRVAVDEYQWIIHSVAALLDPKSHWQDDYRLTISHSKAYDVVEKITDLLFHLLTRASMLDSTSGSSFDHEVTLEVNVLVLQFQYLLSYLLRFQRAVFAQGRPELLHAEARIQRVLHICATCSSNQVRQCAAFFLIQLLRVCYEQTGSCLLVQHPILRVFCKNLFVVPLAQMMPLGIAVDSMRSAAQVLVRDSPNTNSNSAFWLILSDLLDGFAKQLDTWDQWKDALDILYSIAPSAAVASTADLVLTQPGMANDFEAIEESLYSIASSISALILVEEKKQWMDALLRLHVARKKFAEAANCKLVMVDYVNSLNSNVYGSDWILGELRSAREYAEKVCWYDKSLLISERLLLELKKQDKYKEYANTLRYMESTCSQLEEQQSNGGGSNTNDVYNYYKVSIGGSHVIEARHRSEHIYKRSKFTSLGEFVNEMKAILLQLYPLCEKIEVLSESKPFPTIASGIILYLKVTTVEEVLNNAPDGKMTFRLSTPFTLHGGAYGKTSEQMKRLTFLTVAQKFPCVLNRQLVLEKREEIRSPIENSMDDIRKRCDLLQAEILKEEHGLTDLKTLTLLLKGSVDTHVHGGVPEVVEAFFSNASSGSLMGADGAVMNAEASAIAFEALRSVLVTFLQLCWQCLMISRDAFRRTTALALSANNGSSSSATNSFTSSTSSGPTAVSGSNGISALGGSSSSHNAQSGNVVDDSLVSPLQQEFEKSFLGMIELIVKKMPSPIEPEILELKERVISKVGNIRH